MKLLIKLICYLSKQRKELRNELKQEKHKYKALVSYHLEETGYFQARVAERDKEIKRYKMYFNEVNMSYKDLT